MGSMDGQPFPGRRGSNRAGAGVVEEAVTVDSFIVEQSLDLSDPGRKTRRPPPPGLAAERSSLVASGDASSLEERIPRRGLLGLLEALPFAPPSLSRAAQARALAPLIIHAPRILPEVAVSIDDGWHPY